MEGRFKKLAGNFKKIAGKQNKVKWIRSETSNYAASIYTSLVTCLGSEQGIQRY